MRNIVYYYETENDKGRFLEENDQKALEKWDENRMICMYRENLETDNGLPFVIIKEKE